MFRERLNIINEELDKHLLKVDKTTNESRSRCEAIFKVVTNGTMPPLTTILQQIKNIKNDASSFELPVIHERSKSQICQ